MTMIYADGFDHYGPDATTMLDGIWAEMKETGPNIPAFGARTGTRALIVTNTDTNNIARRVLGGNKSELFVSFAFYRAQLPTANGTQRLVEFADAANNTLAYVALQSTGTIELFDSVDGLLASSGTPIVTAGAWNHLGFRVVMSAAAGVFECRVNDVEKINVTGLAISATPIAQLRHSIRSAGIDTDPYYIDDLVVNDAAGTYNNDFVGDAKVITLLPDGDNATVNGWTPHPRERFGAGIVQIPGSTSIVKSVDNALFELGSGDFTIEGQVRFNSLPGTSDKAVIFAKWDEDGDNERSYELYKAGPTLDSGDLVFKISTDGAIGTETILNRWPWQPTLNQWYHIAIVRNTALTYLFIDGEQVGEAIADANTYFDGTAQFTMGAEIGQADTSFDGFMDEVRFTKGVGRYTADFSPPTANFPRSAPSDPDFASVSLLVGYDAGITDESSNVLPLTTSGAATRLEPADSDADFETLNLPEPRDDTFMAALFEPAQGELWLTGNAVAAETVTIGTQTYTWRAAVAVADDVLIGATASDSIDNLIAAITNGAGEGTEYGTGTLVNADAGATARPGDIMNVSAILFGTAGNSIATTETMTAGSFRAATLLGGLDIPAASQFSLSNLPIEVTAVKSITLVNRGAKTDSGASKMQASFVVADGSSAVGADSSMTEAFTYREDIFEEDPSTSGILTPSTINGAEIKINRTE